jgi:probable rRNA maturation factor
MDAENAADEGGQRSTAADAEPPERWVAADEAADDALDDAADRVEVDVSAAVRARGGIPAEWLAQRLSEVLEILDGEGETRCTRVSIRVVDDVEMDEAHRRFSGVEGTTDVLTFVSDETSGLGVDVVVCLDEADRRAAEFGHAVDRELLLYAVHGVLHALGHDDHEPEAHARMHAEEDRLLRAIGVGPVYRPGGDA